MKNKLILLALFQLFISAQLLSQTLILDPNEDYSSWFEKKPTILLDESTMLATYRMEIMHDTVKPKAVPTTNVMMLQIGNKHDKYFDLHSAKAEEFVTSEANKKRDPNLVANETMQMDRGTLSDEIYWNYPQKGQLTNVNHMMGYYLYEEAIPVIKWKMEAGTKTVADYVCQKAVCQLFGRKYTVWYTPKIPVSKGPWKFSGLPGLILEVADDRNQVSWTCIGLEKKAGEEIFFTERDYMKTNKQQFLKSFNDYKRDPIKMFQSAGMINSDVGVKAKKTKANYTPIERE